MLDRRLITMGLKQETCNSKVVLLIVIGLTFGNGVSSSICDSGLCSCSPRYRNITTVDCRCNAVKNGFNFTARDFGWQFHSVREFYLSDCNDSVTFTTNAFRDLGQLENLYLDQIGKVEFQSGVFQKLIKLNLQNIRQLEFGERALMGAQDLHSIEIRRATLPQLRSHALFDIKGLHRLELSDVVLHRVEKDSMKIDLNLADSLVLIKNCTIDNIESNGIVLKANNVSIVKSTLDKIAPNAINIISSDLILISESHFGINLSSSAMNMVASVVEIRSNVFKFLPSGIMTNIKLENNGKLVFTNNTVNSIQIGESLGMISGLNQSTEIRGNHLPCTCVLHRVLPAFSRNNFCTTRCNISLTDFGELVDAKKVCISKSSEDPDEAEICGYRRFSTTLEPHGRMPSYFRTQKPSSTKATITNKHRNSAGTIQFVPVFLFFSLFTVMFKP